MIQDVDSALEALVRRDALNGSRVEVLFDAPTKEWVSRRNAPTVDIYLYDIREDLTRRAVAWQDRHGPDGRVVERRPPARRFRLSYIVTAWTQRPEDEHRLLSALLGTFLANESLPQELLGGALADLGVPVILNVAMPPSEDRSIADVWTALGGELKPSLDIQVITPFAVPLTQEAGKPVFAGLGLEMVAAGGQGSAEGRGAGGTRGGGGTAGSGVYGGASRGPLRPDEESVQEEIVSGAEAGPKPGEDSGGRRVRARGFSRP